MASVLRSLISFLTIVPTRGDLEKVAEYFHWSPLITAFREAMTGVVLLVAALAGAPPVVSSALALSSHLLLQGMHHFDGLVDAGEALLASRAGRNPLDIMKDKHRGGFAIGVGLSYGLIVWSLLASLAENTMAGSINYLSASMILAVSGAASAASMCIALYVLKTPPYQGLGQLFKQRLTPAKLLVAVLLPIAIILVPALLGILLNIAGYVQYMFLVLMLITLVGAYVAGVLSILVAYKGIGYATGDVAGMVGELAFTGGLLASVIYLG